MDYFRFSFFGRKLDLHVCICSLSLIKMQVFRLLYMNLNSARHNQQKAVLLLIFLPPIPQFVLRSERSIVT